MSKRRRRIFSREFKLSAIERMLGGESTKALARGFGLNRGIFTNGVIGSGLAGLRGCGRLAGRESRW